MCDIEYKTFEEVIDDYLFENDREQYELFHELLDGIEAMDTDEYQEKYVKLGADAQRILDEHEREFCDNAIGDDSWMLGRD